MNQPELPPDLLRRYLAGTCTPTERRQVDAWYRKLGKSGWAGALKSFNQQALFERIRADITDDETFGRATVQPLWSRSIWGYVATGVAAVAMLVLGFLVWPRTASTPVSRLTPAKPMPVAVYHNTGQQVLRQRLPDGTVVWLNPGAELTLSTTFRQHVREVQFRGEAFFDVAKDAAYPFVIRSGRMTTQVLGTSFNVKALQHSNQYEVSVVTGRVSVSAAGLGGKPKTVVLKPQQQATYQLATHALAMSNVAPKATEKQSWQPVSLTFEDATLAETARTLERAFAIQITLDNPDLADCRLTVDFTRQRLPEILEVIDKLLGTEYTLIDNKIPLTGRGCPD